MVTISNPDMHRIPKSKSEIASHDSIFNSSDQFGTSRNDQFSLFAIFTDFLPRLVFACNKKTITWRLLSIPLFLISFDTVALIVFFVVPCCHLGYLMYLDQKIKKIYVALISATLLLLAPLYYIVDHQINPPQGGYATMYTPQKLGILRALLLLLICAAVGVWLLWKRGC